MFLNNNNKITRCLPTSPPFVDGTDLRDELLGLGAMTEVLNVLMNDLSSMGQAAWCVGCLLYGSAATGGVRFGRVAFDVAVWILILSPLISPLLPSLPSFL